MNKNYAFILLLILVCFISNLLTAAPGDTTRVFSHDETHWRFRGYPQTFLDTVQFPEEGTYSKIIMHYVLGCPQNGCSEWDYKTNIEVWNPITDSTFQLVELARVITPYAGNKNYGWFHEYRFDVTDYADLLKGECIINAYYGGFQDGFSITVYFDFIEGTPPRDVLGFHQLYRSGGGGFKYGFQNDPINAKTSGATVEANSQTKAAFVKHTATGHGFGNAGGGNPDNCAEFCRKWFNVNVNGAEQYREYIWDDGCGAEANFPQTGTWIYNRAGWCPGGEAQEHYADVTSAFNAGATNSIDLNWQNYVYTGGSSFDIHYWVEAQLFEYDSPNFNLDVEVENILVPNTFDRYSRDNPTCGNPKVVVRNIGAEKVTSVRLFYGLEGNENYEYSAATDLEFLQRDTFELQIPPHNFYSGAGSVLTVNAISANGRADDQQYNNENSAVFESVVQHPGDIMLRITTNNRANENWYYLRQIGGDTMIYRDDLQNQTNYFDTLSLEPGCYEFYIYDEAGDGLNFWADNTVQGGNMRLTNLGLDTDDPIFLENFPVEFGTFFRYTFTVGYDMKDGKPGYSDDWQPDDPLAVEDAVLDGVSPVMRLYPNPAKDRLTVDLEGLSGEVLVRVTGIDGKLAIDQKRGVSGFDAFDLDISSLSAGIYIIRVKGERGYLTEKVVIQ